jgi:hypothetical protein
LEDHAAWPRNATALPAWRAGADICADLVNEIIHSLTPAEPEWRVAIDDETGKTLYHFG